MTWVNSFVLGLIPTLQQRRTVFAAGCTTRGWLWHCGSDPADIGCSLAKDECGKRPRHLVGGMPTWARDQAMTCVPYPPHCFYAARVPSAPCWVDTRGCICCYCAGFWWSWCPPTNSVQALYEWRTRFGRFSFSPQLVPSVSLPRLHATRVSRPWSAFHR